MASGSYYIYGISDDGINPPASAYSSGQVTITEPVVAPVYQRLGAIKGNLDAPSSIATDATDRIYVAETSFNRLSIYSPGGHFLKRLEGLDNPFSIAVDSTGRILVGNGKTGNVEIYDFDFNLLSKLGSGDGEFKTPCAIAVDISDNIYVADCGKHKIKIYNPDGSFNFSFGGPGNGNGQFNYPTSITIDETYGEIIIPDTRFQSGMMGKYQAPRVQVFDKNGMHKRTFGIRGVGEGVLFRPEGVAVDSAGRLYISDGYQNVVQVFDNTGTYLTPLYDNANPIMNPLGVAMGSSNRLFIAVHGSERIDIYGIDNFRNMVVSPLSLVFVGSEGGANPALQNLNISNSGTDAFSWSASSSDGWITLSAVSGSLNPGGISTLNVGVDMSGLTAGTYTGTVEVNAGSGAPETVSITLTVTPPLELSVSPSSLVFDSVNGSVPLPQSLAIDNIGGGTLDWTASPDMAWISLSKSSGTAPDILNVSVDPSSLGAGTYSGNINVSGAGALGSPAAIPVTLNVISLTGTINVTANHAGASFVINGPASYSGSGTSWSTAGAPIGTYVIAFGHIAGYITPPSQGLTLQTGGTINFSGLYQLETGTITVTTNRAESTFTLSGPASYSGSGTSWSVSDAPVGTYDITFGDVPGYRTPSSETQTLQKDGTIAFNGQYDINYRNIISGAGHGESNPGLVEVSTSLGQSAGVSFTAHNYMYGVNVAAGDIDGNGFDEIITAPGPGPDNPSEVRIFDRNGNLLTNLNITAFIENGGANVASADFDGDGNYEVIAGTGADRNNPANVKVFVYDPAQQNLADSGIDLLAYSSLYGVNVTAGDVDGNGTPELITSPGPGSKNLGVIKIWSIDTSQGAGQWTASLVREFTVQSEYKHSVTIAAGDVNGDGKDEIITGDGPNRNARDVVRVFDENGLLLHVWQAGTSFEGYGANVASGDLENDGVSEIVVAPGPDPDNTSYIKIFDIAGAENAAFYPFNMQYGANITTGNLGLEVQQ
jgi:hypothetical protein